MAMCRYSTILGLFSCIVGLALGYSKSNSEVVYQCAKTLSPICFINSLTFEDATANLKLSDVADKKTLNIKGKKIEALQSKHCASLSNFEKVFIGRVGLTELCFTTSFVQVSAEHNRLRKLHLEPALSANGATYRLEELRLNDNQLESIDAVCNFAALKELHLERNLLSSLSMDCFGAMTELRKLYLAYNRLNIITTTTSELQFPALSFIGLQNNTLTELNLDKWSLPALEVLELSSNNLTNVRGLATLEMLSDISLARNRWHCDHLDQMLAALDRKGVFVKDGDQNCSGIRNGTICCTYESLPSEGTLLDELKRLSELAQRYDEAKLTFNEMVKREIEAFEEKITELKETFVRRDDAPTGEKPECVKEEIVVDGGDDLKLAGTMEDTTEAGEDLKKPGPTPAIPEPAATCECTCSKDSMDELKLMLTSVESNINANNVTLQALRDNQSQLSYMALLAKHEFRTAVKRGEYKLKELSSMLSMLREHIEQKQKQH